jgi:hypothetical protein
MKQIIWFIHAWLARQTTSRDWPWDGPNLNRSMKRLTLMFWSSSRTISIFNATVTVLGAHCPLELRFDAARIIAGWPNESAENDAWSQCVLGTPAARSFEARIPDTGSWLKRHLQLARESKGNLYQIEKIRDDQSQHLHSWAEIWSDHDHDYLFVSHVGGPSCSSYLEGLLKG